MGGHSEHAPWANLFTDLAQAYDGYEARLEISGCAFVTRKKPPGCPSRVSPMIRMTIRSLSPWEGAVAAIRSL
jgi:hypothetical protein